MEDYISVNLNDNPNQFYSDYYNKPVCWFNFRYDTTYKIKSALDALSHIRFNDKRKNIFEYGFGSGLLLSKFKSASMIAGVEISPTAINSMIKRFKKNKRSKRAFKFSDINDIYSFPPNFFHLIITSHVIEHFENLELFFEQIRYLITHGGLVLVQIPINENYNDPKHFHNFTSESIINLFTKRGFKVLYKEENEFLFHIVEDLYFNRESNKWTISGNIKRILYNLLFSQLPYKFLKYLENIYAHSSKKKPRQAVLIFKYEK